MNWIDFLKAYLKELLEKHEPLRNELLVPASAQEEFEGAFSHIAHTVYVTECSVGDCCYIISMEHVSLFDQYRGRPMEIIRAVNLAVRRFYHRHGLKVSAADINVFPAPYGFVIRIGLNGYGRKKIRALNREQYTILKK